MSAREHRPDGAARPPAELLEQLRLRLSLLADNHPSASPDSARRGRIPDWLSSLDPERLDPPDRQAPPDRLGPWERLDSAERLDPLDRSDRPGGAEPPDRPAEPDDKGASRHSAVPGPDASADGWSEQDLFGDGQTRGGIDLRLGRSRADDAYRPWFMSADATAPWFAD